MKIAGLPNFARYESAFAVVSDETQSSSLDFVTVDEERLCRVKHTYGFPLLSMQYCLDYFGIKRLDELDYIVTDFARRPSLYNDGPGYRKLEHDYLKSIMDFPRERLLIINHHLAHAAQAFYASEFEEAAVLIVDGMGSDLETQTVFHARGRDLKEKDKGFGWGPGALYSEVTSQILGFTGLNGVDLAGKTMGLAPLGRNVKGKILDIGARYDGLNADYSHFISRFPKPQIKQKGLRPCVDKNEITNDYYTKIAHEVQEEAERAMIHFANHAYKLTKSKRLCISGGVGLNSVANGKILENTPFKELYVAPCCSDTGISLALAMYGYYNVAKPKGGKPFRMPTAYTGITYASKGIRKMLDRFKLPYAERNIPALAKSISEQKIVGWCVGGSETGPRALGHRSMIVDPRKKEMKDILNRRVKHREDFRPFAPAILEERVSEYFPVSRPLPFMLEVHPVLSEKQAEIPAVVHVDGTGRLQTVNREQSPEYYDLISEFEKITGVPVLLNTSFNDQEPIVETPRDALMTWLRCDMDILVLEDVVLEKSSIASDRARQIVAELEAERAEEIARGLADAKRRHFKGYSDESRDRFLQTEERLADWRLKYRALYELEKFLDTQKSHWERVVIFGTDKHTRFLYERMMDFPKLDVVGYIRWDGQENERTDFAVYREMDEAALRKGNFDRVLVSSHEYQYRILRKLDELGVPEERRVVLYDNAADSLLRHATHLPVYNPAKPKRSKKSVEAITAP